jgi:23S rRNA U2552 (ribose-2'-O)-methylase RlmE/FtsJ
MNDIEQYVRNNTGRIIFKWSSYFDVYDRHFSQFRNKEVVIVEIGVANGGSLQLWKNYFGSKAKIYGVDINPVCKDFEEENIQIFIGSQSDRKFLKELKSKIPPIDILIDDGGHKMDQQRITFEELFGHIKENGVYFCEDMHTSYWIKYGGGLRRKGTFIEYTKKFVDKLNAWHSDQRNFKVDDFTKSARSVHFYESIVVVEKAKVEKPELLLVGTKLENSIPVSTEVKKNRKIFVHPVLHMINSILRTFHLPGFIWK